MSLHMRYVHCAQNYYSCPVIRRFTNICTKPLKMVSYNFEFVQGYIHYHERHRFLKENYTFRDNECNLVQI